MTHAETTTETTLASEERITGDLAGRKVLFIAYFFPPTVSTGVPGSQRTVKFLRNLSNGECHVLTVPADVSDQDDALRHLSLPVNGEIIHRVAPWDMFKALLSLRKRVKGLFKRGASPVSTSEAPVATQPAQSVFRSGSDTRDNRSAFQKLKDFIYDLCYFPDQAGPWILPATRYGKKLVRQHDIDVIFATGSPWSGLITGYLISKATGKPLIVDFRDPWMDNPFHQSKGRFLDSWASKLERKVVNHASAVSLNTPPLRDAFIARYPDIEAERFFVMPNGFDLSDFDVNPATPDSVAEKPVLELFHAGFLYGVRDPAPLLDGIRKFNNEKTSSNSKTLRFVQIGDVQLAYDLREKYKDLLADGSLELRPPQTYQECMKDLANADALVNIQPFTESQVPSKLYDYLALNKPMISITPDGGALSHLVKEKALGMVADPSRPEEVSAMLAKYAEQNACDDFKGYPNRSEFDVETISGSLASTIRHLAAGRPD